MNLLLLRIIRSYIIRLSLNPTYSNTPVSTSVWTNVCPKSGVRLSAETGRGDGRKCLFNDEGLRGIKS